MKFQIPFAAILICLSITLSGQKQVDLKLKLSGSSGKMSCFDIQLRSPQGHDINVAGQNYRLFYDAGQISFLKDQITNNLDEEVYSKIDLINTENNSIGFVSMSIDSRMLSTNGISLPRNGEWQNTINICFEREQEGNFDITWANRKRTFLFATAEVAMSEWESKDRQQVLIPNELKDFSTLEEVDFGHELDISVFPNPVADYVHLAFETPYSGEVLIKDIIGRHVYSDQLDRELNRKYDLSGWPEGGYTVMVLDSDGQLKKSLKVIKINK